MTINSKCNKKTNRNTQRALIIKHLAVKHDVTVQMIYQAMKADKISNLAEEVIKEYNHLMSAIDKLLK